MSIRQATPAHDAVPLHLHQQLTKYVQRKLARQLLEVQEQLAPVVAKQPAWQAKKLGEKLGEKLLRRWSRVCLVEKQHVHQLMGPMTRPRA